MPVDNPDAYNDRLFSVFDPVFSGRRAASLQARLIPFQQDVPFVAGGAQGGMMRGTDLAQHTQRQAARTGAQASVLADVLRQSAMERADARALFDEQRRREREAFLAAMAESARGAGVATGIGIGTLVDDISTGRAKPRVSQAATGSQIWGK